MQEARRTQFAALGAPRGHVVMLGDSITEFGIWHEWFPHRPIANRGIGGEMSGDVLARLHTAVDRPIAVFLLIGTNDLSAAIPQPEIIQNVTSIVDAIVHDSPEIPVIVQSVMPRSLAFRDEIIALNQRYRQIVETSPARLRYLDLWPTLATPEGALQPEFTKDKLHLNGSGYRAWVDALRPIIGSVEANDRRASELTSNGDDL